MKLSLRAKGLIAFVAVAVYMTVAGLVLGSERQQLLRVSVELEQLNERDAALAKVSFALDQSLLRLQGGLSGLNTPSSLGDDVAMDVELIQSGLQLLQQFSPEFGDDISLLGREVSELRRAPAQSRLLALQDAEREISRRLDEMHGEAQDMRKAQWKTYYRIYDRTTLLEIIIGLFGAVFFGGLITLFFTRLAWDIRKLETYATAVVTGYRGPPLDVTRSDEVGSLMEAVNRMQSELVERDRKIEIAREQHFYQERMAAVGSLAAAVAHEINNPIAAIAGIAQSMCAAPDATGRPERADDLGGPQMILEQTQRISTISRQIAEFTRPRAAVPELLDLNALVRSTCKFIAYDRRLGNVDIVLELDPEMPAIEAVADHLSQVLMNLMINSADALTGVADRAPAIRVATRPATDEVVLTVADNGDGMDAATLARAFEESFSTKPSDRGRGLGLHLCKTLVERDGGRIELESTPGRGTTATVRLPLQFTSTTTD